MTSQTAAEQTASPHDPARRTVVVIGSGLAGLTAALRLAEHGHAVTLVSKGLGGLQLSQGTLDIFGYDARDARISAPLRAVADPPAGHPYRMIGTEAVRESMEWLVDQLHPSLGEWVGDPEHNLLLPTAVGAMRPTALAPASMAAGVCEAGARFAIVGIRQLKDFYPDLIAGNLERTPVPGGGHLSARAARIDLGARPGESDESALTYARALDLPETRTAFVSALRQVVGSDETVGVPAVLGLNDPRCWHDIADQLGQPIFEIPLQPPSVPGMRINQALIQRAKDLSVRLIQGSSVVSFHADGDTVTAVTLAQAGRRRDLACDQVVYAPGGFESGGLAMDSYGHIRETTFGLPLAGLEPHSDPDNQPGGDLIHGDYWGAPQLLFRVGVAVDDQMRVVRPGTDEVVYTNLRAAGGVLGGATRWAEKSGEGIAAGSGWAAAEAIRAERPAPANRRSGGAS